MAEGGNYLVISDLQIPFEALGALEFCKYLRGHFDIPQENVLCVGDELDCLHGGMYPKDPNGSHTPKGELAISREKIREWGCAFPKMKLCISNHGMRWVKKATAAEIPSELLRSYQEIIDAPPKWQWKHTWEFRDIKHPFRMIHGLGYSGQNGHRTAALDGGISTLVGHLHSHAGISYIKTASQNIWGFNVGCLIDIESYAFAYGQDSRFKPCLGAGVILDEGRCPIWVPFQENPQ